jgi:hypothetical protein
MKDDPRVLTRRKASSPTLSPDPYSPIFQDFGNHSHGKLRHFLNLSTAQRIILLLTAALVLILILVSQTHKLEPLPQQNDYYPHLLTEVASPSMTCISDAQRSFPSVLLHLAGYVEEIIPSWFVLLSDRGQHAQFKAAGESDHTTINHMIAHNYDDLLSECLSRNAACIEPFSTRVDFPELHTLIYPVEKCLLDRLASFDIGYVGLNHSIMECFDPIETAFIRAPPLIISCLVPEFDCSFGGALKCEPGCYECISSAVSRLA